MTTAPRPTSRWKLGVAIAGSLGLLLLALVSARVVERGRFALAYSTYGAGPEGTLGLYELAAGEGLRVERWSEDLGRLPPGGMLVLLGGCDALSARPLSRAEREHLEGWVRAGGVLVVAGAGGIVDEALGTELRARSFSDCEPEPGLVSWARSLEGEGEAGLAPPPGEPAAPPAAAPSQATKPPDWTPTDDELGELLAELDEEDGDAEDLAWATPIAEPLTGMPFVSMRRAGMIDVLGWDRTRVLLVSQGKNVGVASSVGDGVVVTLASASMFQNRDLAEGGGAALFLRLASRYAPGGRVVFDEYHVGAGERRSMVRYFGQLGIVPALVQGLFAISLVLVARGRRFGGVREVARAPVSATAAFVHALSGLFRGSKDRKGALDLVRKDAYVRIARFHHVSEREPEALARALEERGRDGAAEAVREIAGVAAPDGSDAVRARSAEIDAALERALSKG